MSTAPPTPVTPTTPDSFEIEAYRQVCEDFRQLNQSFWQAPVIIVSITGGIGLALTTVESWYLRISLLLLACICNAAWAAVIVRLRRGVMKQLLDAKHAFESKYLPISPQGDGQVIMKIFVILLLIVAISCLAATPFVGTLFPIKKKAEAPSAPLIQNIIICISDRPPTPAQALPTRNKLEAGKPVECRQGTLSVAPAGRSATSRQP